MLGDISWRSSKRLRLPLFVGGIGIQEARGSWTRSIRKAASAYVVSGSARSLIFSRNIPDQAQERYGAATREKRSFLERPLTPAKSTLPAPQ